MFSVDLGGTCRVRDCHGVGNDEALDVVKSICSSLTRPNGLPLGNRDMQSRVTRQGLLWRIRERNPISVVYDFAMLRHTQPRTEKFSSARPKVVSILFQRPSPGGETGAFPRKTMAGAAGLEPSGQDSRNSLSCCWLERSAARAKSQKTHIFARLRQNLVGKW